MEANARQHDSSSCIFDAAGHQLSLEKELARGGEGSVYDIVGDPG